MLDVQLLLIRLASMFNSSSYIKTCFENAFKNVKYARLCKQQRESRFITKQQQTNKFLAFEMMTIFLQER